MSVCALKHNSFVVYAYDTILDFNLSKADFLADIFNRYAVVLKRDNDSVKIRMLA